MIRSIFTVVFLGLLFFSTSANAAWLVSTGKVEILLIYPKTQILVKLSNNGSPIPACSNKEYFSISSTYSEEARNRMFSTLLAAKMAGKDVSISYNDVDNCDSWDSVSNVYRKVTRITF